MVMRIRKRHFVILAAFAAFAVVAVVADRWAPTILIRQRDVTFVSRDGVRLAGTVSTPRWRRGLQPGVVVVHGSGPLTRSGQREYTTRLVRKGFAVLAYDKRGTGASGGVYREAWRDEAESLLRVLADDAAAALRACRQAAGVDPLRVGFFGGSQAGWIITLASAQLTPPPRFNVILSGAAVPTGVEEYYSRLTGDGRRPPRVTDRQELARLVRSYDGKVGFDPRALLAASRVPTLWLLGSADISVPTFATVDVLGQITRAGNDSHDVIVYDGADHYLRLDRGKRVPIWRDIGLWLEQVEVLGASSRSARGSKRRA